jgi:hypothetical protein
MWFDDDTETSLGDKVVRAAERYRSRFGATPDTCCVNPALIPDGRDEVRCGKVRVVPLPNVLPHHFWMGVMEEEEAVA